MIETMIETYKTELREKVKHMKVFPHTDEDNAYNSALDSVISLLTPKTKIK